MQKAIRMHGRYCEAKDRHVPADREIRGNTDTCQFKADGRSVRGTATGEKCFRGDPGNLLLAGDGCVRACAHHEQYLGEQSRPLRFAHKRTKAIVEVDSCEALKPR